MSKTRRLFTILNVATLIFFILFNITGCFNSKPISKNGYGMGTYIKISVYDRKADIAIEEAFARIKEIEDKMSINKNTSEVIEINKNAGEKWLKVSTDTYHVIKEGIKYSELTKGNFDITVGPIVRLWNIGFENTQIPSEEEISKMTELVDYNMIMLNEEEHKVKLEKKGMMLDLGGIAKGFAADEALRTLAESGIESAIVNIGGDISVLNTKPSKVPWKIGIQDPLKNRGENLAVISLIDESIVTSGYYERYFEKKGKVYHHILNPFTGMPAETGISSVTVITKKSVVADALSTGIYVLGFDKGLEIISKMEEAEAVIVNDRKQIFITSGLQDRIELTNNDYELITF